MNDLFTFFSPVDVARAALWLGIVVFAWFWLRGELTPARFLTIFESEAVLSIRLILAAGWSVFIMCMLSAGRVNVDEAVKLSTIVELLLSYGIVKVLGKAWAERPAAPPATVNAKKANVDVAGDANISTTPDLE